MKIAVYSRKSVYTSKGDSIENQVQMCKDYILSNIKDVNLRDIIVYEDEGFSAKNINRPQFKGMILDAKKEKYDYIVCYRLDRISRSVSDFSSLIEELNLNHIGFICIKEQFDTSTPMGRAMMYIASVFAQLERETIAERVRDNMMMLARTGRWLGGAVPTGFISQKETNIIVEGKIKTSCSLKVLNSEIGTVKKIYKEFLSCGSLSAVSKYLASENIRSQKENYFTPISIKNILSNPVYCAADKQALDYFKSKNSDVCFSEKLCNSNYGLTPYNRRNYCKKGYPRNDKSKWIIAIGKHKGIISGKDWAEVQNMLDKNKTTLSARNNYALLSGFIVCERCGKKMLAKLNSRDKNGKFYYYICENKLRYNKLICDCPNLNGAQTDNIVCDYILNYIKEDRGIVKYLKYNKLNFDDNIFYKKLDELDMTIKRLELSKEKYITHLPNIAPGSSIVKEIEFQIKKLHIQLEFARLKKSKLINNVNDEEIVNSDENIKKIINLKKHFGKMEIRDKKLFLRLILERSTWDGSNLNLFIFEE